MTNSAADYENLLSTSFSDANTAVRSGVRPRWERKQQQAKLGNLPESRKVLGSSNGGDRFIPNRAAMDMEISAHLLRSSGSENNLSVADSTISEANQDEYKSAVSATILGVDDVSKSATHRILSFKEKAPTPRGDTVNNLNVLYSASAGAGAKKTSKGTKLVSRHIPSAPSRILDAPDLMDDYYLNLLSWSDTNVLAVALAQTVYLWNAASGDIQELCTLESDSSDNYVSSVSWVQEGGAHLAIGTSSGTTQLWDVQASKQLRSMDGHTDRVSALGWNRHTLTSAGRDTTIINHDVRTARHNIASMQSHTQEVCSLSWSRDGDTLASGGNDNKLCLWDVATSSTSTPRFELTDHQAAVKALAWSPHERNLLASGAGTADRTIKFWNSQTGSLLNNIDTGSQVCALQWNPYEKEILSSHGFAKNELCLWKYPSMAKIKELDGHTARVLHMACGPDGAVVSAAADETLRFWNIFAPPSKKTSRKRGAPDTQSQSTKLSRTMHIR